jgi:hypothetical protein
MDRHTPPVPLRTRYNDLHNSPVRLPSRPKPQLRHVSHPVLLLRMCITAHALHHASLRRSSRSPLSRAVRSSAWSPLSANRPASSSVPATRTPAYLSTCASGYRLSRAAMGSRASSAVWRTLACRFVARHAQRVILCLLVSSAARHGRVDCGLQPEPHARRRSDQVPRCSALLHGPSGCKLNTHFSRIPHADQVRRRVPWAPTRTLRCPTMLGCAHSSRTPVAERTSCAASASSVSNTSATASSPPSSTS